VTCPLKARIVDPEETAIDRQRPVNTFSLQPTHVTSVTTHATTEELLEAGKREVENRRVDTSQKSWEK
jgi:hypothetical protein